MKVSSCGLGVRRALEASALSEVRGHPNAFHLVALLEDYGSGLN